MKDAEESKQQLRNKLEELRHRISELEVGVLKQRQTEEELRLFEAIVESSTEAIAISDPIGQLVYINPAHEKLFGYSLERARQLNYRDYYPPESVEILDQVVAPALVRGESWEGGLDVYDANGRLFPLWERADTVRDAEGKMLYRFGLMHDITENKRVEEELRHRDAILEVLATSTKRALETTSFDAGIQNMLEQLGQATEVSRVYIFENHLGEDGTLLTSQRYEWVASTITSQLDNPDTQDFPWIAGGMGRWVELLSRDETVQGYVKDFPQSEREILSPQGIQSITVVPIFVGQEWWGFIGFDECSAEREWAAAEIDALKVSAGTLGALIQRKKAEESLLKSEEFNRTLLETMADRVFAKDRHGRYTLLNKISYDFWGIPYGTALGKTDWEIHHEITAKAFVESDRVVFETGKPYFGEEHVKRKDGRDLFLSVTKAPLKDKDGKITGLVGTSRDITDIKKEEEALRRVHDELQARVKERTAKLMEANEQLKHEIEERKQAEEALKESNETLRAIINASPLAIMSIDSNSKVTIWNPAAESIFGWTEHEVLGQYNPMVSPEKSMEHQDLRERSFQGEPFTGLEVIGQRKDGTLVDVSLSTAPVYNAKGNIKSIMAVIEDITERKLAEEALRESEQRYSSLFKNNHSVMLLIDPDSADIVDANPAACSFYGWSQKELTSKKITDINMLTNEQVFQEMERARSAQRQHFYFRHRLASEEVRDVEVYSGPIMLHGKQLLYSIIHDISKRKQAEEELQRAHEGLEQRTAELVKLNETLKQEIEERKQVEQKLRKREAELEIQASELEEVNTALRVLLKRRDEDKVEVEEKTLSNVKELVLPYIERLKSSGLDARQTTCVSILESNLRDIVSPFAHSLSSKYLGLTPTEIQIANLVKQGMTTKEIAEILNSSHRTVEFHRKNIRKKMGIVNRKVNLRSHLLSM